MAPKRKAAAKSKADDVDGSPQAAKKAKTEAVHLKAGDAFPDLGALQNEAEESVDLSEVLKETGIVLFAYPKANTPGCTNQACGFRDNYEAFKKAGYEIYCISGDKPKPQLNWKTKQKLPYHLLCDPGLEALEKLGIKKGPKSIQRSHIIVEKGGKIAVVEIGVTPKDSVAQAVEFIGGGDKGDAMDEDAAEEEEKEEEEEPKAKGKGRAMGKGKAAAPAAKKGKGRRGKKEEEEEEAEEKAEEEVKEEGKSGEEQGKEEGEGAALAVKLEADETNQAVKLVIEAPEITSI